MASVASIIASAYPAMASYADDLVRVADDIGIDPGWLANVINFESGGNPQARNPSSSATGLIQFIKSTASRLGTSVDALYGMTGQQQMAYVKAYLSSYRGRLTSQEDVYMAVFYPVAIGNPSYSFPSSVTAVNPGIYTPRDYANKANTRAKLPVDPQTGRTAAGKQSVASLFSGTGGGGLSPVALALTGSAAALAVALVWVYRDRLWAARAAVQTNPRRRR